VTTFLASLALALGGGFFALVLSRFPRASSACAVIGLCGGAVFGEAVAFPALFGKTAELSLAWPIPYGALRIAIDPLSAFFLVPIFALPALAAIYGREYTRELEKKKSLGHAWFSFNLLVASMAVVATARHAVLFLIAWEVMTLAAYVLVTLEHEHAEVRRAGFVYLIASHVGTSFLVALFVMLGRQSFDFDAISAPKSASLLFVLALVGFGVKAGFPGLHIWLPEAHAAAPSHVSAVMSGVLIKMGLYGFLRVVILLGAPRVWWGPALIAVGIFGALLGICLALYQRDIKRVLAYSSIENVGLITLGIGLGLWGRAENLPAVAALGFAGALLHAWNHTLMKGLLFLGAGSVLHACGTKDIERLGGMMKRMPRTSTVMIIGAVAISALPPLNGFASEWLLYLGFIAGALAQSSVVLFLAVGAVALVSGLTALCFVRLVGIALLGEPRSEDARRAHESPRAMTLPMIALAAACIAVAIAPPTFALTRAIGQLGAPISNAPVTSVGAMNAILWLFLGAAALFGWRLSRRAAADATWGCGYAGAAPRAQYTGASFAEIMTERLFPRAIRPRVEVAAPRSIFPAPSSLTSRTEDPLTRGIYEPFLSWWADRFGRLRWFQQGMLHIYLVQLLVAACLALGWLSIRDWFVK